MYTTKHSDLMLLNSHSSILSCFSFQNFKLDHVLFCQGPHLPHERPSHGLVPMGLHSDVLFVPLPFGDGVPPSFTGSCLPFHQCQIIQLQAARNVQKFVSKQVD